MHQNISTLHFEFLFNQNQNFKFTFIVIRPPKVNVCIVNVCKNYTVVFDKINPLIYGR